MDSADHVGSVDRRSIAIANRTIINPLAHRLLMLSKAYHKKQKEVSEGTATQAEAGALEEIWYTEKIRIEERV